MTSSWQVVSNIRLLALVDFRLLNRIAVPKPVIKTYTFRSLPPVVVIFLYNAPLFYHIMICQMQAKCAASSFDLTLCFTALNLSSIIFHSSIRVMFKVCDTFWLLLPKTAGQMISGRHLSFWSPNTWKLTLHRCGEIIKEINLVAPKPYPSSF